MSAAFGGTSDYEVVACDYTGFNWAGLEKNVGAFSLMDGSVDVFDSNYAVG